MDSSLSEKTAFFELLEQSSKDDEDEDLGPREETDRQRSRRFFRLAPAAAPAAAPSAGNRHGRDSTIENGPMITPARRVVSAPVPSRVSGRASEAQVIKGTPVGALARKGRLAAALHADSTVIGETPPSNLLRPGALLKRSDSTPLPPTKRLLGRALDDSPAVVAKRRRRDAGPNPRPEEEQIFRGLAFFYVPDNDIAPARRLRINKAREYGAAWTRDVGSATHVVVEKNIAYADVKGVIARGGEGLKVVNEEYPIDCIQFRAVLDHKQKKYQLVGQPTSENDVPALPPPGSGESTKSLKLKPAPQNRKKWDYVGPASTPTRSEESPILIDSQPITLDIGQVTEPSADEHALKHAVEEPGENQGDELSEYISVMQEYKDLPLDIEDDTVAADDAAEDQSDIDERPGYEDERAREAKYPKRNLRSRQNGLGFEDQFACNQATVKDAKSGNPNARTIEVLQSMASYYDRVNDHWRTTAYRKAINTLKRQHARIATEDQAFRLPSIGRRLAQKIEEIATTDRLQRLEYAQQEPMDESLQLFLGIYGVGTKQAQQWVAQGFRTLDDLRDKAKLSVNQLVGVDHYEDLNTRIPRREVAALGDFVKKAASRIDPAVELLIGGSYRRGSETSGDVDFIVTKPKTETSADLRPFLDELVQQLQTDGFLVARLASSKTSGDGSKWHGCCVLPPTPGIKDQDYRATWRRIDFLLVPEPEMGAALMYFTGNDIFNRSMRLLASKKGMRLNQRGLYRDVMRGPGRQKFTEGELVEGRDEREIFRILGVNWREPHERCC